ncbi:AMP-binding protein [Fulvivirga ligni]|uniref:AMP-binding protein n=1 Tax=Fulvivirga ligni TaxID=2904246 RepID=UPI001F25151D|nr:AMP-binding protein [Fulvivirga ligni]UII23924.1 AMP-binding protein [Fulvivirga ligni]
MTNSQIFINGKELVPGQLGTFTISNPFEESTVRFIDEWLSDAQSFSMQTSGSTGKPKIISVLRSQMEASAKMTMKALGIAHGTALVCLDTAYIAGKMMLVRALMHDMTIWAVNPGSNPLSDISIQPDFAALVPLQVETILQNAATKDLLNKMKSIIVGGAPVSKSLERKISALTVPTFSTYGMTETVSHIALKKLNGSDSSNLYNAFDEVQLGLDERGCLTINSVVTNHETIITNDSVDLKTSHSFEWLGRIDNVINSGGIKVQSEKVERVFEKIFENLEINNRFFISGLDDDTLGKKVVMIIESSSVLDAENTFLSQAKTQLTKYELPKEVYYVKEFMETKTGKVNRRETLELL